MGQDKDIKAKIRPGPRVLPPEIRALTMNSTERFPDIIRHEDYRHLDSIGPENVADSVAENTAEKAPTPALPSSVPQILLCGDTSEVHRWGVNLDENDFFRQVQRLEELIAQNQPVHTVIGVRRTNFHRLPKTYDLVRRLRGRDPCGVAPLIVDDPKLLWGRFHQHLGELNAMGRSDGIEFLVVDDDLEDLLHVMEGSPNHPKYDNKLYLMALGAVCKDVFTGPRFLLLDLNGYCNVDCIYCRQFSPWSEVKPDQPGAFGTLPFRVVQNVIDEAAELDVHQLMLIGRGEPTMHPEFGSILDLANDRDLNFNVSTNGVLLDRYLDKLLQGSCSNITLSLSFASEETFRRVRPGTKISLKGRIERNARRLAELKREREVNRPELIALYAICKPNFTEIVEMVRHAHGLGADSIWFQMIHVSDWCQDKLGLSEEEMVEVRASLRRARDLSEELGLTFHTFIDFELRHFDVDRGDWSREGLLHQGCYVGWHFGFVSMNSELYMCCGCKVADLLGEDGVGLAKAWYSDAYRRYRNDALIMHRENPIDVYGKPLYDTLCDECYNHDQQEMMLEALETFGLSRFVER